MMCGAARQRIMVLRQTKSTAVHLTPEEDHHDGS
jgi:hypothetical protein